MAAILYLFFSLACSACYAGYYFEWSEWISEKQNEDEQKINGETLKLNAAFYAKTWNRKPIISVAVLFYHVTLP